MSTLQNFINDAPDEEVRGIATATALDAVQLPPMPAPDLAEIKLAISVLVAKGSGRVVELRALKTPEGTYSGYYNNSALAKDSYDLSLREDVPNVYWTIQEIDHELIARRKNVTEGWAKITTSDNEVVRYIYLPIDFDPKRLSGMSSTDCEKQLAFELANTVRSFLLARGIQTIFADSGNGYHLLARIDMAVHRNSTALVKDILKVLANRFGTEQVSIDTGLYNPARILKAYGTVARKGSHTAERPWRISRILDVPEKLEAVSEETLRALVSELTETIITPKPSAQASLIVKPAEKNEYSAAVEGSVAIRMKYIDDAIVAVGETGLPIDKQNGWSPWDSGAFIREVNCPWGDEHTDGGTGGACFIVHASSKPDFRCQHAHCVNRRWKESREEMERIVGHYLPMGNAGEVGNSGTAIQRLDEIIDAAQDVEVGKTVSPPPTVEEELTEKDIPPFDPTVVKGICAKFVELITRGTTLPPQFAFGLARTILGLRMAGNVSFEDLDADTRIYFTPIGGTGTGKGWTIGRMMVILRSCVGESCKIKIINSVDSGAGLKDHFWDFPEDEPILFYAEEIRTLGNKSKENRNPAILDDILELRNTTTITRNLAKNKKGGGGTKTKNDARLAVVLCGQNREVFADALAGRADLGAWDRLYPEFAEPVEAGETPPVNKEDAVKLLLEFNEMNFLGVMKMAPDAKAILNDFWASQLKEVRTKVRWKMNLQIDAYLQAFAQGRMTVNEEDVKDAILMFKRQVIIRGVFFRGIPPDRIGHYMALCKRITERMERKIASGIGGAMVAKSEKDYNRDTHAYNRDEDHIFNKAFWVHRGTDLEEVTVQSLRGRTYRKYLPARDSDCYKSPEALKAFKDGKWEGVTFSKADCRRR